MPNAERPPTVHGTVPPPDAGARRVRQGLGVLGGGRCRAGCEGVLLGVGPIDEAHASEPGLVVVEVAAFDDATVFAFREAIAARWATATDYARPWTRAAPAYGCAGSGWGRAGRAARRPRGPGRPLVRVVRRRRQESAMRSKACSMGISSCTPGQRAQTGAGELCHVQSAPL
ncbi:DUF6207 family protein [Streptomyces sp. NPDC002513]